MKILRGTDPAKFLKGNVMNRKQREKRFKINEFLHTTSNSFDLLNSSVLLLKNFKIYKFLNYLNYIQLFFTFSIVNYTRKWISFSISYSFPSSTF